MILTEQQKIKPKVVRGLRLDNHMSQQELASAAGLSQGQVNRIEAGHIERPHFKTVRKLAGVFGVEPSVLLEDSPNGDG